MSQPTAAQMAAMKAAEITAKLIAKGSTIKNEVLLPKAEPVSSEAVKSGTHSSITFYQYTFCKPDSLL